MIYNNNSEIYQKYVPILKNISVFRIVTIPELIVCWTDLQKDNARWDIVH